MDFRTTGDVGATGPLAPIPRRILPGIYIHRWSNIGWRAAGYNVLTPPMGVTGGYSKNCNTSAFSEKSRLSLRPAPMPRTYYSNRPPHCPTGRQDLQLTPTARTYASHFPPTISPIPQPRPPLKRAWRASICTQPAPTWPHRHRVMHYGGVATECEVWAT